MNNSIHPTNHDVLVQCTCGTSFKTRSTSPELRVTLCSGCHPFFTGAQRYVDTAGRIEKFTAKYAKKSSKA